MRSIVLILTAVLTLHWKLDHEMYVPCKQRGRGCRFQSSIAEYSKQYTQYMFDCTQ